MLKHSPQNFITNSGNKSLQSRLKELVGISKELKFLVGFFYFSGIKELYETLKELYENGKLQDEHIKILVGLKVDKGNFGLYEASKSIENKEETIRDFIESIKIAFTNEKLDKKEIYEQAEFFVELLEKRKLVIRKTKDPNHAKLYLFKTTETGAPELFITGSSNLTLAGIESQNEFNVEIKDYGFKDAEEYFDAHWERAIELSAEDVVNAIRRNTFLRYIDPFVAYVYLIKNYLDTYQAKYIGKELISLMEKKGYRPYSYQIEAVSQAIASCEAHGGVILADVVGLGKSIVACMVGKAMGKRGIVLSPPHLIGDDAKTIGWKKYLEDFELYGWEVWSIGKLDEALQFVKNSDNIDIVVIDEAHRFRNEDTASYNQLKEICRGRTVMLLTATPFNNKPSDIFSLLKLFTIPKKSTIVLDENLKAKFDEYEDLFNELSYIKKHYNSSNAERRKKAKKYYKEIFGEDTINIEKVRDKSKMLARRIKAIVEPVLIRRNRLDLKHYKEKIDLPIVRDPIEWFYELTQEQSRFYDEVIRAFDDDSKGGYFKGAIYIPIKYEKGITNEDSKLSEDDRFIFVYQKNLYDFMRRLLVKRFESSFGSFYESIKSFKRINETALKFIEKSGKFILDRKLMEDIVTADPDDILKERADYEDRLKNGKLNSNYYKVYDLSTFKLKDKFIEDIQSDIDLFDDFIRKIKELNLTENDPKADRLVSGIEAFIKENRKVVIFTEYIDTAKHLDSILKAKFGNILLSAYGNIGKTKFEEIAKNFDAQNKEQEDKYSILLATDKLSEGYNLNRAGVVINYDIPWNPVRVIQRVGRINRMGKKVYDEIYIVNFFPTEKGSDIVKSREIAQNKMFMIHNILGEDAKIFDESEEPTESKLYKRLNTYQEGEEESFFTKLRDEFENIKNSYPDILSQIEDMPKRVKTAKKGQKDELFVFIRKGKDMFVGYKDYQERQPKSISFEEAYEKIKANKGEKSLRLSDKFWKNYEIVLAKDAYIRRRSNSSSLESKALNLLQSLLNIQDEYLKPFRAFIIDLKKDIEYYGSLSDYVLRKIVEIEKDLKDIKNVCSKLEEIQNEIGEDFLRKIEDQLKFLNLSNEDVIISVENQESADKHVLHRE